MVTTTLYNMVAVRLAKIAIRAIVITISILPSGIPPRICREV